MVVKREGKLMRKHDVSESTKRSYYELMCNMLGFEIIFRA